MSISGELATVHFTAPFSPFQDDIFISLGTSYIKYITICNTYHAEADLKLYIKTDANYKIFEKQGIAVQGLAYLEIPIILKNGHQLIAEADAQNITFDFTISYGKEA